MEPGSMARMSRFGPARQRGPETVTEATYRKYTIKTARTTLRVAEDASPVLRCARDTAAWGRGIYARLDAGAEHFCVLALDAGCRVVGWKRISTGTLTCTLVHPRDVFFYAIGLKAQAIVLIHNHPSGDPEPSREDRELTARLARVGILVGIHVHDHVILAEGCDSYESLAERQMIPATP